jgi:hypothetical protein
LALYDRQITAIKQVLAAHPPQRTEQEPTPKIKYKMIVIDDLHPQGIPVEQWVNQAQRTWVGLTEQQRNDIEDACEIIIGKPAFDAIEAKLKEKNT